MEATTQFDIKPLLRPDQLQSARDEIASLEAKLSNPLIQDKGEVRKQLVRARKLTDEQTPRSPTDAAEEARMAARSKHLLGEILEGMPSQEEMRKAPPGAVDKHRKWERRNKLRILEWKNLQLRMTVGSGDRDVANLERHRPTASTLSMDNAQIPGKYFFMPEAHGPAVTFSDEQLAVLRTLSPMLADAISLMTNAQRADVKQVMTSTQRTQVKDAVAGIGLSAEPSAASIAGKRGAEKKRRMSEETKAKLREAARRKREARAAREQA